MSDEKSNAEVLENSLAEPPQPQPVAKLIKLNDTSLLVCRVLPSTQPDPVFVSMWKPYETFNNYQTGQVYIRPWIPESDDEVFLIPVTRITNVSNPDPRFLEMYAEALSEEMDTEEQLNTFMVQPSSTLH